MTDHLKWLKTIEQWATKMEPEFQKSGLKVNWLYLFSAKNAAEREEAAKPRDQYAEQQKINAFNADLDAKSYTTSTSPRFVGKNPVLGAPYCAEQKTEYPITIGTLDNLLFISQRRIIGGETYVEAVCLTVPQIRSLYEAIKPFLPEERICKGCNKPESQWDDVCRTYNILGA